MLASIRVEGGLWKAIYISNLISHDDLTKELGHPVYISWKRHLLQQKKKSYVYLASERMFASIRVEDYGKLVRYPTLQVEMSPSEKEINLNYNKQSIL